VSSSAQTHGRVQVNALFTASTDVKTRPRDKRGRPDGNFPPKSSFMTSLLYAERMAHRSALQASAALARRGCTQYVQGEVTALSALVPSSA
jgi:hypothetical protein